jgi:hypothetical protein
MKRPIFVRELTDGERQASEEGLRSSEAFVLRRAQILAERTPPGPAPAAPG